MMRMDIRQESSRHAEVMDTITRYLGLGSYLEWNEVGGGCCGWVALLGGAHARVGWASGGYHPCTMQAVRCLPPLRAPCKQRCSECALALAQHS